MLWLFGFVGVGKTAIAQTIAEDLEKLGLLGAAYFCLRTSGLDDANVIVPTIAYQLCVKLLKYKEIITKRLYDDPLILEKDIRSQFRALLAEPFRDLTIEGPNEGPLLIIVDGLDECHDKDVQLELIEVINSLPRLEGSRFLWLICSRPECHLKTRFSNADFPILCRRLEVPIDDSEAQNDVLRILRAEFGQIRCKYSDQLSNHWPPEAHLLRIATAASGHLGFASFIMKFIGDQEYDDPAGQLDVCMRFLGGPNSSITVNPLHALDLLFWQILSDIPSKILGTTLRILGFIIVFPRKGICAQDLANFLSIDRGLFYQSLRLLYSLLNIPSSSDANRLPLRIAHASFSDFLLDPHRSRGLAISPQVVLCDTAIRGLDWLSATKSLHGMALTGFAGVATHHLVDEFTFQTSNGLMLTKNLILFLAICGGSLRMLLGGHVLVLQAMTLIVYWPNWSSDMNTVPDEFPQFLFWLDTLVCIAISICCGIPSLN
jgi:hypothetical protein